MTDKMTPAEALAAMDIVAADLSKDGCQFTAEQIRNARATLAAQLQAQAAEVERLQRESEGRRVTLLDKAEEARREWMRAEAAEAEVERLREAAQALRQSYHALEGLFVEHSTNGNIDDTSAWGWAMCDAFAKANADAIAIDALLNPPVDPATINAEGEPNG
jgi:hypothetical protein